MKLAYRWTMLCAGALLSPVLSAATLKPTVAAEPAAISLATKSAAADMAPVKGEASFANAPPNFHTFASAQVGVNNSVEELTLRFAASTTLTSIETTKDFRLVSGGSCAEGMLYTSGRTCTLLVEFTPQGPGARLGRLAIAHTASATPFLVGLGGNGYAPVVSFNPAMITTVPGTFPSSAGLLSGAQNLTVDGGDTLYIADTGNDLIRYIDSSGVVQSLTTTAAAPWGIAVDNFGEVYFDVPSTNLMYEIYDYGPVVQITGTGTGSCPVTAPCYLDTEALSEPGNLSIDAYNHLFFTDAPGAAMATVQPVPAQLIFLYDPFPYQESPTSEIAVDESDNIYTLWANGGTCSIIRQTLYDAENTNVNFIKIAGGHTCGFAGDGGSAGNAEIGSQIGQMTFDIAGNLYFSDTMNQRVRRIDASTGLINTIAGTGTAGYSGDGAAATAAQLSSPTGVAVDSQGQVYVISAAAATGAPQVVRKLGPNGYLNFGTQTVGSKGAAQLVTVSNSGNSTLTIANTAFTGSDPGDFSVDPTTTSCILTPGATLYTGQSCKVGILVKPAAPGARTANFVLLDNTVTNSNTVSLAVAARYPAPTFTITSPASGTSVVSGTTVTFAVSVTATTTPAPTGKVSFYSNGTLIKAVTLAGGTASVQTKQTTAGTYTLSAKYAGDGKYLPAGPITLNYIVTAAAKPSKTLLSASANPAEYCVPLDFAVKVTGSGADPTGTVQVRKGGTVLVSGSLSKGLATLSISPSSLAIGANVLTAHYLGDAKNLASTSAALTQAVASPRGACAVSD